MRLDEQQIRTLVLAQAIETGDRHGKLVSLAEREQAGNAALHAARRSTDPQATALENVLFLRAQKVVDLAVIEASSLDWLRRPRLPLRWLATGVPLAALVLGIITDRVANPHRVDLLSLPLLGILAWNLFIYFWLVAAALPRRQKTSAHDKPTAPKVPQEPAWLAALWRWLEHRLGRHGGRAAPVASAFLMHWHSLTAALTAERFKRILHLSAAAWAAGIALSLLARGLVVQYDAGWESTFLQAEHVHAILAVLFWPLTTLFAIAPFSPQEVAELRDFAVRGQAGARWVYLYAGLLTLVVILPRLALAAWARWRERRLLRGLTVDLHAPYYQDLAARLAPARIVVALLAEDRQQHATVQRILRRHADAASPELLLVTAEGDELRLATDPERAPQADVVLLLSGMAPSLPQPWQGLPVITLKLKKFAACWVQETPLFEALKASLPVAKSLGFERLRTAWNAHDESRFQASMAALATQLVEVSRELDAPEIAVERLAQASAALSERLLALHRLDSLSGQALEAQLQETFAPTHALSKTQAGVSGAAAGAALGASVDAMTAFISLGAASALGALVGGSLGLARSFWQRKDVGDKLLQGVIEAGLMRYLAIEHFSRTGAADGALRASWKSEAVATVAAQWKNLAPLLSQARKPAAPAAAQQELAAALQTLALGMLKRIYLQAPAQDA